MKTATRGNAAEARILAEFVGRGFDVLIPFGGGHPYDLVIDLVPLDGVAPQRGRLRLEPAKNNQRRNVRLAAEFEIDRWTREKLRSLSA